MRRQPAGAADPPTASGAAAKVDVVIIGGGLGGVALAVKLKQAELHSFVLLESSAGLGGTWYTNDYPGCEVDIPSILYSYSFQYFPWTRTHARQPELLRYIDLVVERFGLLAHARLRTRVSSAVWSSAEQAWTVRTEKGETFLASTVVSGVGLLSDPNQISWPGVDTFRGTLFHSSQWPAGLDVTGKRVAVVGVGSTSAQIVPTIADDVEELLVFQREPGWVLPKNDRDLTEDEIASRRRYWLLRRLHAFVKADLMQVGGAVYRPRSRRSKKAKQIALDYLATVFADRPDLRAALTPQYAFSGKRRVASDDFYPALCKPTVKLVPRAVAALDAEGIVDAEGDHHKADIVIAAVGFKAPQYLSTLEVVGAQGRTLHEVWGRDGAYALSGLMVPGFPNFYMLYGPNTNGGTAITYMLERQSEFVVRNVRRMRRWNRGAIEARPSAVRLYNRFVQRRLRDTAWVDANNYAKSPTGKIVTQWGDGMAVYGLLARVARVLGTRSEKARRGAAATDRFSAERSVVGSRS